MRGLLRIPLTLMGRRYGAVGGQNYSAELLYKSLQINRTLFQVVAVLAEGRSSASHPTPSSYGAGRSTPGGHCLAGPAVVRCKLGILTVETASPAASIGHL
jgi:hypothetical protein